MKNIIPALLVLLFIFADHRANAATMAAGESPSTEMRSHTDSVSYALGAIFIRQMLPDLDFIRQTLDVESFVAGMKDKFMETVTDLGLDEDYLDEFMETSYYRFWQEREEQLTASEKIMMQADGFNFLRDGLYYKVSREGTGRRATEGKELVILHVRTYDEFRNILYDTREDDEPEEGSVLDLLDYHGDELGPALVEGAVIEFRARRFPDYDEEPSDGYLYEYVEYEIIEIKDAPEGFDDF